MNSKWILVTGGAGFIGSNFVPYFLERYPGYSIVNIDKLTYAGNLDNLSEVNEMGSYEFIRGDICNRELINYIFDKYNISGVIHFAAESHVDRSIMNPMEFIMTNIVGTVSLLNAAKNLWKGNMDGKIFYHVSTDEVWITWC